MMPRVLSAPHAASKVSAMTFSSSSPLSTQYTGILREGTPKNTPAAPDTPHAAASRTAANRNTAAKMMLFRFRTTNTPFTS